MINSNNSSQGTKPRLRLFVLISALLIFTAALVSSFGVRWQEDILSILPEDNPQISKYRQLIKHFNPMDAMFVDVGLSDTCSHDEEALIRTADSLFIKMERSDHFSRLMYKWDFSDLKNTLTWLLQHRAELFTKEDSLYLIGRLQADSIYKSLENWKQQLAESPAPFLVGQMLADPLGFDKILLDKLAALQNMNSDVQIIDGRLFSKDRKHILLIAYPKYTASDSYPSRQIVSFMDSTIQQSEISDKVGNIKIAYLSGHRFSVENAARIKRDIQVTVTVSLVAISLLALLIYSSPFLMLLTLLPAIFGSVVSLGLMRWLVPDISVIVIGSGAMLIGLAVDYGIHFLFHVDQLGLHRGDAVQIGNLLRRLRKPLLMSAASTVLAFLTLQFSILPGYNQLGLFVSMGIVSALSFVLFVLPYLLPQQNRKKKIIPTLHLSGMFAAFFSGSTKHKKMIFILLAGISTLMVPGILRVQFEGDVQKLNAVSEEIQEDWDTIADSFGGSMASTYVMVVGSDQEQALRKNDQLFQILNSVLKDGYIESFNSVSSVYPSQEIRRKNQIRWDRIFTQQKMKEMKSSIIKISGILGFKPDTFNYFADNLSVNHSSLQKLDVKGTILQDLFANHVSETETEIAILSQIKIRSYPDFAHVKKQLESAIPDVVIYNGKDFVSNIVLLIFSELKRMGFIVFSLIFILLILYKRSLKTTLALSLPLVLSILWTFGILGWLGIKINIINSIVSVFVFGLVIDYCFFLHSACEAGAGNTQKYVIESGGAVSLSALTTMLGLGALILAKHPALHSLGLTALLGIFSGWLTVMLLLPAFFCRNFHK